MQTNTRGLFKTNMRWFCTSSAPLLKRSYMINYSQRKTPPDTTILFLFFLFSKEFTLTVSSQHKYWTTSDMDTPYALSSILWGLFRRGDYFGLFVFRGRLLPVVSLIRESPLFEDCLYLGIQLPCDWIMKTGLYTLGGDTSVILRCFLFLSFQRIWWSSFVNSAIKIIDLLTIEDSPSSEVILVGYKIERWWKDLFLSVNGKNWFFMRS